MDYDKICAYVGNLYLESQHTLFLFKKQISDLNKEIATRDTYILELEERIKDLMSNGHGS
jgi:cell division protein FtsL